MQLKEKKEQLASRDKEINEFFENEYKDMEG